MKYEFSTRLDLSNPFQDTIVIEVEIPKEAVVTLTFINENGQLLTTPIKKRQYPVGKHSLQIDKNDISPEARYYRLIAEMGNSVEVDVKKIIVGEI